MSSDGVVTAVGAGVSSPSTTVSSQGKVAPSILFWVGVALAGVATGTLWWLKTQKQSHAFNVGDEPEVVESSKYNIWGDLPQGDTRRRVHILYATTTGTARNFATTLEKHLSKRVDAHVRLTDATKYSDLSLPFEDILLVLASTYEGGVPPESARVFFAAVEDLAQDFRVGKELLPHVEYAVFGLGGSLYEENFATVAKTLDEQLEGLGGNRLLPVTVGDDQTDLQPSFYKWSSKVAKLLETAAPLDKSGKKTIINKSAASSGCCGGASQEESGTCCGGSTPDELKPPQDDDLEEEDLINDRFVTMDADDEALEAAGKVVDLEDLGPRYNRNEVAGDAPASDERREMVTKLQRKALTKEGYKIIGTHSAVKLCRWTKNQLRGRGGCYKHSFYGITSYQCMEATPSLACANKCVFCWRHHKNPVGTEWRWKEDSPELIVQEAIRLHQEMIKTMRGVPEVQVHRLEEAFRVRHCALSLVGEPIMYPKINEMMRELHTRGISTFMVTNAQFPERIAHLDPVTQLYVSVDAATKESLRAVDRPLFKDFWERFLGSLQSLRDKQQRTVYRMTLVKSWNMNELEDYVQLIEAGQPDFIEIKSVTYCGKSDASSLTMQNVPWHEEVCAYAEQICQRLRDRAIAAGQENLSVKYSIATEHEHSCCILIAREDKFKVNDEWYTWIDYDRFESLIKEYYATGKTFRSEDYRAKTPSWAVYKSAERGFDPIEQRWRRNAKSGEKEEIPYEATESGCG